MSFDSNQELMVEIKDVDRRIEQIGDLEDDSASNFINASDSEEAKAFLFEWAFFDFANWQLHAKRMRFEGEAEESKERVNQGLDTLDQIKVDGDWTTAKNLFVESLSATDLVFENADRYAVPRDLSIRGVMVFHDKILLEGDASDKQFFAWEEFLNEKISKVPDKTEPYVHPDIDRLKAEIAS